MNGLTWADLAGDLVVRKATTKTGAFAAHDLRLCPLVVALLNLVPADRRVGPLIVAELAGRNEPRTGMGNAKSAVER